MLSLDDQGNLPAGIHLCTTEELAARFGSLAPNDVDVVFLPGPGYPRQGPKLDSDELVWPFLQIIAAADDEDFEASATTQFSTDRKKRPKGVVEVIL